MGLRDGDRNRQCEQPGHGIRIARSNSHSNRKRDFNRVSNSDDHTYIQRACDRDRHGYDNSDSYGDSNSGAGSTAFHSRDESVRMG